MTRTAKNPSLDLFSKLVRHTPARPGAAHILARSGHTNGASTAAPLTSAKNNLCVHFTHTRTHTRVRYPRGVKRLFGQKRRFSRFSALEPTLGLLLVFSNIPPWNAGSGTRGGGQQPFFIIWKQPVATLSVISDRDRKKPLCLTFVASW